MSTVAFGALSTRREQSDSGKSTSEQPPGVSSYVDILAALVPAEVLAINSIVVASVTAQVPGGPAAAAEAGTYRWMFGLLLGLAAVLFVLGRRPAPAPAPVPGPDASRSGLTSWQNWEWQDLFRMLIPSAAYLCWTMIEPSGVWSAIVPGMSSGTRLLIPLVGAAVLGAVTKGLASHADKKPSPAQRRAAAAQRLAPHPAQLPAPNPVPGPVRPIVPAPEPPEPPASEAKPIGPAAPTDAADGAGSADDTDNAEGADTTDATGVTGVTAAATVPSWVY